MFPATTVADANLLFSDDQAVTATAISTNVLDLAEMGTIANYSAAHSRYMLGTTIPILVKVTANFATLTSLTVTIESDSTADLATSPTVHASGPTIAVASLLVDTDLIGFDFLPGGVYERYLGLRFTVAGSDATAGTVFAALGMAKSQPYI